MVVSDTEFPETIFPKLSIRRRDHKLEEFPLSKSPLVLGRVKTSDVVIHGDPAISRQHCRFEVDFKTGTVEVTDLGSSNGTFVNGAPANPGPVTLRPGDVVQVGATTVTLSVERAATSPRAKSTRSKFPSPPWPPVKGEAERTRFQDGNCICGRCGAVLPLEGRGPGEKLGCLRCRAVWRIPPVKPLPAAEPAGLETAQVPVARKSADTVRMSAALPQPSTPAPAPPAKRKSEAGRSAQDGNIPARDRPSGA